MATLTENGTRAELEQLGDAALVLRVREDADGGQQAFRVLYDRYRSEVHAFLTRLLGDAARAEDVLQEAFLGVYTHLDGFDASRPFRPWLYRIARNAALDALRSEGKIKRLERARAGDGLTTDGPSGAAAQGERIQRLERALATLPAETRALLIQRHGLCMKLSELAQSYDCTERTVRNRLRRAAGLLARALVAARRGSGGEA